jgi:hypothetical protein
MKTDFLTEFIHNADMELYAFSSGITFGINRSVQSDKYQQAVMD